MTLARKGAKGWMSSKTKLKSKSLRGKKEALKQKSWDSIRVWWAPVLAPWTETPAQFGTRLRAICRDINDNCNVEGLCMKLPERVQALADAEGDRISK